MRVLLVAPGFPPAAGGVETVVAEVTGELAARAVEVEVWAQDREVAAATTERWRGATVRRFPARGPAAMPVAPGLFAALRSADDFDVIHAHNFHSAVTLGAFVAPPGPKFVLTAHFHGGGHTVLARAAHVPYAPLADRAMTSMEAIAAVSRAEAAGIRRHWPELKTPLRVIPNGVDNAAIATAERYDVAEPVLLITGRHERYKRIDTTLRAVARSGGEDFRVVVLGDGPARNELEALASSLGLTARVDFRGHVSTGEVRRWLRTATAVVNLSEREAFGLAALEAVAAGSHAVVSDIPAHREVAEIAPTGSISVVTHNLDVIATMLADVMTRNAPGDPRAVRSWSDVAADHLRWYGELLEGATEPHTAGG